jgi:hypothetical protein
MVWWMALALAGDVWMTVERADDGNQVRLELPVNQLVDEASAVTAVADRGGRAVDLRSEVRALRGQRAGTSRRYVIEEDDGDRWPVVLTVHDPVPPAARVDALAVRITAVRGFGLTFDLPLDAPVDPDELKQTVDVEVGPPGVGLDLKGVNHEQLLRGGARTLMAITGPEGKGLEVTSVRRTP